MVSGWAILPIVRVLLTGATGYIGGAVVEALAGAGHVVVAVARSDEAEAALAAVRCETVRGDLRRPEPLAGHAEPCDAVVQLAATQDDQMAVTEQATVRAFVRGLSGSDKPFVYTSGVWVYGNAPPDRLLDEDSATDPVALYDWRPALEDEVLAAAGRRRALDRDPPGGGVGPRRRAAEAVRRDGRARHPPVRG